MARKNIFNSVLLPKVGSNFFDLSHERKLSFKMGWLTPSCVMDCVPGDKVRISVENMLRFVPLIAPVMHRVNVTTHFFFVPNRILWPTWEKWITGDSDVEHPYFTAENNLGTGSLGDYLGYPTEVINNQLKMNPFPVAAYYKVWDEYYRDQNLQTELFFPLEDGENSDIFTYAGNEPLRRAWMHDYFTSALPFAQKGDAVTLPLTDGGQVPVELTDTTSPVIIKDTGGSNVTGSLAGDSGVLETGGVPSVIDPNGSLTVDINNEAATINTLRRAFKLQEWLERNARGGTRYIENILAHFGVRSSDARLQRPEYLGGAFQRMTISEVLGTARSISETDEQPVGYMGGHGISVGAGQEFSYRCEEHGWIIGIINVQPVTAYQQGLSRSHSRLDRLDYYWPSFANIGEQEVLTKELFAEGSMTLQQLNTLFGYVPRYAEYKYLSSTVHGDMKDNLSFWHLGRIFQSAPVLNESFIQCEPSDRIFAVTDPSNHEIIAHVFNTVKAVRKMPKYGIPSI